MKTFFMATTKFPGDYTVFWQTEYVKTVWQWLCRFVAFLERFLSFLNSYLGVPKFYELPRKMHTVEAYIRHISGGMYSNPLVRNKPLSNITFIVICKKMKKWQTWHWMRGRGGKCGVIKTVMSLFQIFSGLISCAIQFSFCRIWWYSDNITVNSNVNKPKRLLSLMFSVRKKSKCDVFYFSP